MDSAEALPRRLLGALLLAFGVALTLAGGAVVWEVAHDLAHGADEAAAAAPVASLFFVVAGICVGGAILLIDVRHRTSQKVFAAGAMLFVALLGVGLVQLAQALWWPA